MAASRRSHPADAGAVTRAVADLVARAVPAGEAVAVALSGGRDSIALLDAATRIAADAHVTLVAFHVHHGLSAHAGQWARFCESACAARGIAFAWREVTVARRPRTSLEAAAREARYDALAALAREQHVAAVMLAHHADDQAETVLLQLLRGGGPRGLAAMPAIADERGVRWLRPLLDLPRDVLQAYVATHGLRYVDDDSNADPRYRRNALRESVVPVLRVMAPGYPRTLGRVARLQAESARLLDDLAKLDAQSAFDGRSLDRVVLRALDPPRARNLLRWFLRQHRLVAPSAARLEQMLHQVTQAADDSQVALVHDGIELGVHRGRVFVHRVTPPAYECAWRGGDALELPHGTLAFAPALGSGIARHHLEASRVTIRTRLPGERLRLGGRARRPVSDLLREAGVPAWERGALPRVYCDDVLAAVACAGVDAAFGAKPGEVGFALDWRPRRG